MNWIPQLLPLPALSRMGEVFLHFLWQGALVAALFAAALPLLRRASASTRYWTACGALGGMAVLPLATWWRLSRASSPSGWGSLRPTEPPLDPGALSLGWAPETGWSSWLEPGLPWLGFGWAVGVWLLTLRLGGGWSHLRSIRRSGMPLADDPWPARLRELAQRCGVRRPVTLLESTRILTPLVMGWLRPVILLPTGLITGLSPDQVGALLAHELAHLRRHDYLVNFTQRLIESALFFHPAVWWISGRIRLEREVCCDEIAARVVGNRRLVAEALVTLAERELAVQELALAATGGSLSQRVRRLLGESPAGAGPGFPGWSLLVAAAAGAGLLWGAQQAIRPDPTEPTPLPSRIEAVLVLAVLTNQLADLDTRIEAVQQRVDELTVELNIPDAVAERAGPLGGTPLPPSMQLLNQKLEIASRLEKTRLSINFLKGLNNRDLAHALSFSHPTPLLIQLLSDLALAEQQGAAISSRFGPQHPERTQNERRQAQILATLETVVKGILDSLERQVAADEAALDSLERDLQKMKSDEVSLVSLYRPYFRAKRELDTLLRMREAMLLQLTQERINTAVSKAANL